jgi:hypothetical protein
VTVGERFNPYGRYGRFPRGSSFRNRSAGTVASHRGPSSSMADSVAMPGKTARCIRRRSRWAKRLECPRGRHESTSRNWNGGSSSKWTARTSTTGKTAAEARTHSFFFGTPHSRANEANRATPHHPGSLLAALPPAVNCRQRESVEESQVKADTRAAPRETSEASPVASTFAPNPRNIPTKADPPAKHRWRRKPLSN